MSPTPSNISGGSLDMTLRDLLKHMLGENLNHVVLIIPHTEMQVAVTLAADYQINRITQQVERILK
jgi:hypothetical protein